jgi:hypothetical protein
MWTSRIAHVEEELMNAVPIRKMMIVHMSYRFLAPK